ncbi:hypothetical protein BT96DRAFT_137215 [Gymnopus androsaceus JB14]|uniref:FAD-binding domain-containing protein n=1 Tax=Gymnopus androsaceus JB14 TaxID=1447944 RepID=A0A6A4HDH3_9AGAR|nr:hypothetical protein BT96DRAFT_137215 [Gymnopus androsaceus JB14]
MGNICPELSGQNATDRCIETLNSPLCLTIMSTNVSIIIVGAGPTGLSLALSLLRNGISVRIIEKRATFHPGERGAGLQVKYIRFSL